MLGCESRVKQCGPAAPVKGGANAATVDVGGAITADEEAEADPTMNATTR